MKAKEEKIGTYAIQLEMCVSVWLIFFPEFLLLYNLCLHKKVTHRDWERNMGADYRQNLQNRFA